MVVRDHFEPDALFCRQCTRKRGNLGAIEVVCQRQAAQSTVEQLLRAEQIGGIQRKITVQHGYARLAVIEQGTAVTVLLQLPKQTGRTNQQGVRLQPAEVQPQPLFTGLEDAWRGDHQAPSRVSYLLAGLFESVDLEKIYHDLVNVRDG